MKQSFRLIFFGKTGDQAGGYQQMEQMQKKTFKSWV
jgi:hypothetical protein